jgi:hypothetical protein
MGPITSGLGTRSRGRPPVLDNPVPDNPVRDNPVPDNPVLASTEPAGETAAA